MVIGGREELWEDIWVRKKINIRGLVWEINGRGWETWGRCRG